MFGLYVLFHGKVSPGGGFQSGAIFATAFILYALIWGVNKTLSVISLAEMRVLSALGVLIYGFAGIPALFMGRNYLDYSVLADSAIAGQKLGIMAIEIGVGITVFSVMLMIFILFAGRNK